MYGRIPFASHKRLLVAAACLALLVAMRPTAAAAHPLGNFSVNLHSHIVVGSAGVDLRYVVDMAEIPTFQEWGGVTPGRQEQVSYLERTAATLRDGLRLEIDGVPSPLALQDATIAFPAGQGGLSTTRIELELFAQVPDAATNEQHAIAYRDDNFADRLGWHEIVIGAGAGVVLRDLGVPSRSISDELRKYPADLLSSPLDVRSATASVAPGSSGTERRPLTAKAPAAEDRLAALVAVDLGQPAALAGALLAALLLGAAHALSPGHGKTIVAAYLVGSRGTPRHALFLGLVTTATHTIGVFALGGLTLYASSWFLPERIYPWLGMLSGVMVVLVGASLLRSRLRIARGSTALHDHDHSHDEQHIHEHAHGQHGHSHLPPVAAGGRVTWRSLAPLAISGGLAPCPTALVLMLGAIAAGRVGLGLALVTVFSAGLALVLTCVGLLFLYGGKRLVRLRATQRPLAGVAFRLLPLAGAVVVTLAGALITLRAALDTGLLG